MQNKLINLHFVLVFLKCDLPSSQILCLFRAKQLPLTRLIPSYGRILISSLFLTHILEALLFVAHASTWRLEVLQPILRIVNSSDHSGGCILHWM